MKGLSRRKAFGAVMIGGTWLAALIATLPLVLILIDLFRKGCSYLKPGFFVHMTMPPLEPNSGIANALVGTLVLVSIASFIGLPIGIGAGLYLAEHRTTKLATIVRFLADVLNGLPSIVIGIFAWWVVVRPYHFSAVAGGFALGVMMIPLVTRTTEEMLGLVPIALREAALALGYSRWRTSLAIVLRTALPGITTGALVAVARTAGETAPLLFTALGNDFWSTNLTKPISALPLVIFTHATSAYPDWQAQAWAASLVLIALLLIISVAAKFATRRRFGALSD